MCQQQKILLCHGALELPPQFQLFGWLEHKLSFYSFVYIARRAAAVAGKGKRGRRGATRHGGRHSGATRLISIIWLFSPRRRENLLPHFDSGLFWDLQAAQAISDNVETWQYCFCLGSIHGCNFGVRCKSNYCLIGHQ